MRRERERERERERGVVHAEGHTPPTVFFSWDMCDLRGPIILSTAFVFIIQNVFWSRLLFGGRVHVTVGRVKRCKRGGLCRSSASRVMNDARGD